MELYLGRNAFEQTGLSALIEVLPCWQNLRVLGLNACGLTDFNLIELAMQLKVLLK
jgi:hypothetical protein